jgi:hypothetical protein
VTSNRDDKPLGNKAQLSSKTEDQILGMTVTGERSLALTSEKRSLALTSEEGSLSLTAAEDSRDPAS